MGKEVRQRIPRQKRLDHDIRQLDLQALIRNSPPELVIISQIISETFKSTNSFQILTQKNKGPSQTETNPFYVPRRQNAGTKIRPDHERLQPRSERFIWDPS